MTVIKRVAFAVPDAIILRPTTVFLVLAAAFLQPLIWGGGRFYSTGKKSHLATQKIGESHRLRI